jgi:hypothetical protein
MDKIINTFLKIFVILTITISTASACDCGYFDHYMCKFIKLSTVSLSIKGRILNKKELVSDQTALYVEILTKYKDLRSISDTIVIYGGSSSNCQVGLSDFGIGDTLIMTMRGGTVNADTAKLLYGIDFSKESFFQIIPFLCGTLKLKVKNGVVSGWVTSYDVTYHPIEDFEEKLFTTCDPIKLEAPKEPINCSEDNINVYPNPLVTNELYFIPRKENFSVSKIKIFSVDGKLIWQYNFEKDATSIWLSKHILNIGLNIIELTCDSERVLKRVIVSQ